GRQWLRHQRTWAFSLTPCACKRKPIWLLQPGSVRNRSAISLHPLCQWSPRDLPSPPARGRSNHATKDNVELAKPTPWQKRLSRFCTAPFRGEVAALAKRAAAKGVAARS